MATLKSRSGPPVKPVDGSRSRRTGAYMGAAKDSQASASLRTRQELESFRFPAQATSQPKQPSRIPQTSSTRPPSLPSPSGKPGLNHQARSLGPSTNAGSGRSGSNIPPRSGLSPSGRSLDSASQPGHVLRKKPSTVTQDASGLRNDSSCRKSTRTSSSSSNPISSNSLEPAGFYLDRGITESPAEVQVAKMIEIPMATAPPATIYPELDRYRDVKPPSVSSDGSCNESFYRLATQDLPPPTPLFSGTSSQLSAFSGSPSTRFSESPGPGPYSRDTTPTSMTSQSPGLVAPVRIMPPRAWQGSPAHSRPPVTRRRAGSIPNEGSGISADPHGLAAVRESLTSSSSNSTVRDGDKRDPKAQKKKRLSPLPPSPPLRKSSQKFGKGRDDGDSPSHRSQESSRPVMTSPSPVKAISSTRSKPVASPRATPPIRPSRDGTPDLQSQLLGPMPIVHSNLSSTSLSTERRGSEPLVGSSLPISATPSPQPDRYQQPSRLPHGRGATPSPSVATRTGAKKPTKTEPAQPTRTPSPNLSTFNTRFPFFGRRSKTAPEVPQVDKKDKAVRKGPAAGTGHEGYGRLGAIRRRSNSVPRATPGASQESLQSTQSYDSFLSERMNPVVIVGGEVVENRNTSSELSRTDSNQSLFLGRPSLDSKVSSDMSTTSQDGSRNTIWPPATSRSQDASQKSRRPSESSEGESVTMKSTLAFRRSIQRLTSSPDSPLRLPKPIDTSGIGSTSVTSLDTSILSDDSRVGSQQEAGRGRGATTVPKKLTKKTRSPRRWNLFGRSHSQPTVTKKVEAVTATISAVSSSSVAPSKPPAFYTLMDSSEQEDAGPMNVEDVLRDAEVFDSPMAPPAHSFEERRPSTGGQSQKSGQLEPHPPQAQNPVRPVRPPRPARPNMPASVASSQTRSVQTPRQVTAPVGKTSSGRPSRLPQVGRIPKVERARPEQTSPKSFSRPFNRVSFQPPPRNQDGDAHSIAKGPSSPKPSTPELTQTGSTATSGNDSSSRHSLLREVSPDATRGEKEFIAFSPPNNSTRTTGTFSSCSGLYIHAATAPERVVDLHEPLAEDEIWDEYNDLLGDDTMKAPPSATSSKGIPFHLEVYESKLSKKSGLPLESPTVNVHFSKSLMQPSGRDKEATASSVYSADMTERIKAAFTQKPDLTPIPVSEIVSDHENKDNSGAPEKKKASPSQRSSSSSYRSRNSDNSSCKISEDESPLAQVNLRVGSMTVSKWLTFGHVLFSPAREDLVPIVGSLKRHSILVIDGLGNDDWSFYAAETYPAATFFNLSPRAPLPTAHQNQSSFPLSPPNHHQIQYISHLDKFPFGPESFTSVVYRFPSAAPESHYRNIVAEARRVLKPGGYLELSILDVDLNNMGNRGRRTIRRLKERIHASSSDVCLGSTADLILRLLSTGFSDIKTCKVGVPVASSITRSNSGIRPGGSKDKHKHKDERSLAEMMNDEGDIADESITKMVAKVGRWWYSRCYENAAGTLPRGGLWKDHGLLSECEEWGTSLKLMVCYARVPEGRARISSV